MVMLSDAKQIVAGLFFQAIEVVSVLDGLEPLK